MSILQIAVIIDPDIIKVIYLSIGMDRGSERFEIFIKPNHVFFFNTICCLTHLHSVMTYIVFTVSGGVRHSHTFNLPSHVQGIHRKQCPFPKYSISPHCLLLAPPTAVWNQCQTANQINNKHSFYNLPCVHYVIWISLSKMSVFFLYTFQHCSRI